MDSVFLLLSVLAGIAALAVGAFFIARLFRRPKMTEFDYYYRRYNSRLIYGDGSGRSVTVHAKVDLLERKTLYGQEADFVVFRTDEGLPVELGIRGESNFSLFSAGMQGDLVYIGNTFVSFTPDGEGEPLLCDVRYSEKI